MRILFIRFGSIGNAVVSFPAVRAARKELPEAYLALLCDPKTYELWKDCPWLDRVLVYDQKGKHKAGPGYLRMIHEQRKLKFTHSVHFRRFIRSELIGFLSGARVRIGFDPEEFSLLTRKIPYCHDEHLVSQNLKLARELGIKGEDERLEYWPKEPSERVKKLMEESGKPLVAMHPFARSEKIRRWRGFADLAERLKQAGSSIVLIGRGEEEPEFRLEFKGRDRLVIPAFDLSVPELASLIKAADFFVGQDSGPLHLAAALGTPAVCIYGPRQGLSDNLKRWQPRSGKFRAVLPHRDCGVCNYYPCAEEKIIKCLEEITAAEVMEKIFELGLNKYS